MTENDKILIVDDKPENLGVLYQLLSNNYEVIAAESGTVALELIAENTPSLILLDILMPEISGFEVCNILKKDPKYTHIPVIFMSALNDLENKVHGFELGAVDYITKPFQHQEVLSRVKTQLKLVHYQNELETMNHVLEQKVQERTAELEQKVVEINNMNEILKESEKRFKTLFVDAPDAIVLIESNVGQVVDANPAAARLFGVPAKELVGLSQDEIFKVNDDYIKQNINRIASLSPKRNDQSRILSNMVIRPDGTEVPVETSTRTIVIDGEIYLQGILRDVSERKIVEERLKIAKEKAEEMNNLKSNFLANMSHELRTPLIGILGFSQFLKEELEDYETKHMAEIIHNGGKRLLDTLNLILDLSQIEQGKVNYYEEEVDLKQVITEAFNLFKLQAKEKGLEFTLNIATDDTVMRGDIRMVRDVFNNLITNSIKFTQKGKVEISLSEYNIAQHRYISVIVNDSGIGIPEDKLTDIFKDFRQGSEGMSKEFEGTGLGLSLAKRFVEFMHGEIQVTSELGKGTEFKIMFPLASDSSLSVKYEFEETRNFDLNISDDRQKILYIEEDFASRELTKMILGETYIINVYENIESAMNEINSKHYDLFLIDVNTNNKSNGISLIEALNKDKYYSIKPKVAVTAFAMNEDKKNLLEAGFTHYLPKPFEKKTLLELIKSII